MLGVAGREAWLVQIGGETCAFGISRRGKPHAIGVQHPFARGRIWTALVSPEAGIAASTSGNYEQPVVIGERVYYHIVDPRTAMPVDRNVASVTIVFGRTGMNALADSLSTACAVLGPEKGLPLVEKLGGEALIIVVGERGPTEHTTAGWGGLVLTDSD
jgi:thiamine biosynthesis lipoprotein